MIIVAVPMSIEVAEPMLMKAAALPAITVIIIRLALVLHVYSKFGTHIIIATSLVINYQCHSFLQSTKLFLSPLLIEIINKRHYLLKLLINRTIFSESIL